MELGVSLGLMAPPFVLHCGDFVRVAAPSWLVTRSQLMVESELATTCLEESTIVKKGDLLSMNIEPTRPTKAKTTRKPTATKAKNPAPATAPAPAKATAPATAQPAPTVSATKPRQAEPSRENVQGLIQMRAYELHCARGYQHGCAMDDWLEAEREILSRRLE
jgi:hypothetical protein